MAISLKAARVNAGYVQAQVAHHIGISQKTICNWESGKSSPKVQQAQQLCKLYGVSLDTINFTTQNA